MKPRYFTLRLITIILGIFTRKNVIPSKRYIVRLAYKSCHHKQTPNQNPIMASKTRNAESYANDDSGSFQQGPASGNSTFTSEELEYKEVSASKPVWGQDGGGKWGKDRGNKWNGEDGGGKWNGDDDGCKRKHNKGGNWASGWWCGKGGNGGSGWGYSSMYIWFIVAPIVIWIILFTTKPSFVTDTVNGAVVINNQKLILWVLILSIIAWILVYAFYYCKY
jgi:hypothetical protein